MTTTITPAPVRKSIQVKAPAARAFTVFTERMSQWWKPSHSINASPMVAAIIEPHEGGRWFERGADGSECQWGRVLVWQPPTRLVLAWQIDAQWKFDPDLLTELEVRFVPEGDGMTRVELEHRHLERFGDKAAAVRESLDSPEGWGGLLAAFSSQAEETPQ
jgi:uncharacterized protein YndB with AHSA1/START domain